MMILSKNKHIKHEDKTLCGLIDEDYLGEWACEVNYLSISWVTCDKCLQIYNLIDKL